ncbi:MAG: hypothetical protein SFU98_23205 [Leptospiraceae bacterium]|nr:hypothetical protein [Leptospiraceae bacterium]
MTTTQDKWEASRIYEEDVFKRLSSIETEEKSILKKILAGIIETINEKKEKDFENS